MPRSDGYLGTKAQYAWETGPGSSHGWPPGQWCCKGSALSGGALCAAASKGPTGSTDSALPLSTLSSPHTDADFFFRYLNLLSHSSMTSSHLLAQIVLQQSAEKGWESRVYRKCDFHVTTNVYTPLHKLSNYPTLFYINSHNLILISL